MQRMNSMEPDELDEAVIPLTQANLAGTAAKHHRTPSHDRPSMTYRSPELHSEVSVATHMTPKMEVLLKKELRQRQEESQYTFKPALATKSDRKKRDDGQGNGPDANRFDRLYSDALKRHLESKWKEANDAGELTFTPKISAKAARSLSRPRSRERPRGGGGGTRDSHNDAAWNRLYDAPTGRLRNPADEPTFQPSISKRAKSLDRRESAKRLYAPEVTSERREKLKQELEEQQLEECTFSPELNYKSKYNRKPMKDDVMTRMSKYEATKQSRLLAMQREKEEHDLEGVTFKPELVSSAKKRSSTPNRNQPLVERLTKPIERIHAETVAEANAEMTFRPRLVSRPSPGGGSGQKVRKEDFANVHEKLYVEGQRRKKSLDLQRKLTKEEMESSFTFSPAINDKSRNVAASLNESEGPVFDRLSTASSRQYMQEVLQKVKEDLELRDCTFTPTLASKSSFTAKNRDSVGGSGSKVPVHERLTAEGVRQKEQRRLATERAAQDAAKGLNFSPRIPEASQELAGRRSSNTSMHGSVNGSVSGGGDQSVTSNDIHSRLYSEGKIHQSPEFVNKSLELRKSLVSGRSNTTTVKPEKEILEAAERLTKTPTRRLSVEAVKAQEDYSRGETPHSPVSSPHMRAHSPKPVLPRKDVDQVVERLSRSGKNSPKSGVDDGSSSVAPPSPAGVGTPRLRSAGPSALQASQHKVNEGIGGGTAAASAAVAAAAEGSPALDRGMAKKRSTEALIPPSTLHQVYRSKDASSRALSTAAAQTGGDKGKGKGKGKGESALGGFDFIDNPASRSNSFTGEADAAPVASHNGNGNGNALGSGSGSGKVKAKVPQKKKSGGGGGGGDLPNPPQPAAGSKKAAPVPVPAAAAAALQPPAPPAYEEPGEVYAGEEPPAAAPVPAPVPPPRVPAASTKKSNTTGGGGRGGARTSLSQSDDFLAKIEQSMSLLQMDPASVVAAQREAEAEEAEQEAAEAAQQATAAAADDETGDGADEYVEGAEGSEGAVVVDVHADAGAEE